MTTANRARAAELLQRARQDIEAAITEVTEDRDVVLRMDLQDLVDDLYEAAEHL